MFALMIPKSKFKPSTFSSTSINLIVSRIKKIELKK